MRAGAAAFVFAGVLAFGAAGAGAGVRFAFGLGLAALVLAGVPVLRAGFAAGAFFGLAFDAGGRAFAAVFAAAFGRGFGVAGFFPGDAALGAAVRPVVLVPALRVLIPENMRRTGRGGFPRGLGGV